MTAWKSIERAVAALVGGERTWNSSDDVDVTVDGWAVEVKNVKAPTIAQVEGWLRHNQKKADGRGVGNALVVKRRAGRGAYTPFLAIFPLTPVQGNQEETNG